jgi:DNA anti-recombination protein RmuC
MADKDLGDITENLEGELENLQNTKMKVLGVTMTPASIMGAFALVSAILGSLYGGFEVYKDYMEMKEKLANLDTDAIEARNAQIEIKLDEAIDYTRDIKSGLRDDILGIEKQVDRMEDKVRETEQNVRDQIAVAEQRFENKRDSLQNDYDEKANRLAERNDNLRTDLENKVDRDLKDLEDRLNKKLQRALDNPLAN